MIRGFFLFSLGISSTLTNYTLNERASFSSSIHIVDTTINTDLQKL